MSKFIITNIKISFKQIPLFIRIISIMIIIYSMYMAWELSYPGISPDGIIYPILSYRYLFSGIGSVIFINFIFISYYDSNTSFREIASLGCKRLGNNALFIKQSLCMLTLLIPTLLVIIPIYLGIDDRLFVKLSFIGHLSICIVPQLLIMALVMFVSIKFKSPFAYLFIVVYYYGIDIFISETFDLGSTITAYLYTYNLISDIRLVYISMGIQFVLAIGLILYSYNIMRKGRV